MLTRVGQSAQIVTALHRETCTLAFITDQLMNSDRTPKTRSVWPTLQVNRPPKSASE